MIKWLEQLGSEGEEENISDIDVSNGDDKDYAYQRNHNTNSEEGEDERVEN